jgi:hypothetical protein
MPALVSEAKSSSADASGCDTGFRGLGNRRVLCRFGVRPRPCLESLRAHYQADDAMPPDPVTDAEAFGASTWEDDEPAAESFEPIDVRPYFPNRSLYRTRGRRQTLRPALRAVIPANRVPRAREPRRRNVRSGRAQARAPSSKDPPEPSDLGDWLARASLHMLAHEQRRFGKGWRPAT